MNRYYGGESDEENEFKTKIEVFLRLITTPIYINNDVNKNQAITDLINIRLLFSNIIFRDITPEYRNRIINIYKDFTKNNKYKTFTLENNDAINIAMTDRNRNNELRMFNVYTNNYAGGFR